MKSGVVCLIFFLTVSHASAAELRQELLDRVSNEPHVISATENRERIAGDPYRPLYHMSAPKDLIHDPNGLCQWKGRYHLFYQYRVPEPGWIIHWGHAYSDDLIHWKDLPIAIKPSLEESCFSGQTYVDEDRVIAIYHGTKAGNIVATAHDELLLNWEKHPDNPVIPMHKEGEPYRVFDPCIWKEANGYYYCLTGSYKDGEKKIDCIGETHIFRSKDLASWEWLGPMYTDTIFAEPGEDLVVPNFWPIGNGKHLLLCFSHKRAGRGYIGTFDLETARFTADYHFRANHGAFRHASIHAPSATIDDKGRYVAIFNIKEAEGMRHEGWDGIMSIPRVYSLAEDNSLRIEPVEEVEKLRFDGRRYEGRKITSGQELTIPNLAGKSMEIIARFRPGQAKEVGLKVLQSPDKQEYTTIQFSPSDQTVSINTSHSTLLKEVQSRPPETAALVLENDETLELRLFIDRCVVEVFANGRQALSVRVYPTQEYARGVSVFSQGGDAEFLGLEAWQMHSVWPELIHKEGT